MSLSFGTSTLYLSILTVLLSATSYAANPSTEYNIKKVNVDVTLYDKKTPQLLLNWKDNLPKDTLYNVIVRSTNYTKCPDPPCSVYDKTKPKGNLTLPENPMSYLDEPECNYMFGCNYSVTVETSKTKVFRTVNVTIPYCIEDACSCDHLPKLPKLLMVANVSSYDTINFNWSLQLDDNHTDAETVANLWDSMNSSNIYLKISEQTNPSLSWGGKLIPIDENIYSIQDTLYTRTKDNWQGTITIQVKPQLTPKAVLNLHSYIIDELRCAGPANLTKLQVPDFNRAEPNRERSSSGKKIFTIALLIVLFIALILVAIKGLQCRRRQKNQANIIPSEYNLSQFPFSSVVEMEDNVHYVDKYIEEAQAKGLADIFEVPHYAIQLNEEIGEGAFGRVYRGIAVNLRRMRGATVVAVKQLKKNPTADEVEEFLSEIEMLKGVGTHNNIVCFLGCCTIRAPYLMIMEYVGRGDLLSYLRTVRHETSNSTSKDANYTNNRQGTTQPNVKYIELKLSTQSVDSETEFNQREPKPSFAETTYTIIEDEIYSKEPFEYILDNKELHNFALQIANGMRFLEEQEITHRDLAARNVLIDERKTLKISDFGLSRHGIYTNTKTRKLPLRWLSIEAIRDNIYSSKSDVWAYGVVLWEIGTLGASPYPTISNHELIPFLLSGKRLEKPDICTDQVYAIMLKCWDVDPENRPTFEELYKTLSPKTAYVDINTLSDDYVFPPIQDRDHNTFQG